MGTLSVAAIAVSISARVAMLLASSSGSSSLWPANRQRISLVLGKPSFLNKPAHGLDIGAAAFSTQHFKFKLKTLQ